MMWLRAERRRIRILRFRQPEVEENPAEGEDHEAENAPLRPDGAAGEKLRAVKVRIQHVSRRDLTAIRYAVEKGLGPIPGHGNRWPSTNRRCAAKLSKTKILPNQRPARLPNFLRRFRDAKPQNLSKAELPPARS